MFLLKMCTLSWSRGHAAELEEHRLQAAARGGCEANCEIFVSKVFVFIFIFSNNIWKEACWAAQHNAAQVVLCRCTAHSLCTTVPGKQPNAGEMLWGGASPAAPHCPPSLPTAQWVLVVSSKSWCLGEPWHGRACWRWGCFGSWAASPGHRVLCWSESLGTAGVRGLSYCCFTVH